MSQNIDTDSLILFAQLAKQTSMSKAARLLSMSVSTLSRRLTQLEQQLDVALLVRHSKGVELTEDGEAILNYANQMLVQRDALQQYLLQTNDQPHGQLKIALPATVGLTVLNELISVYKAHCPQVTLDIQLTDRVIDPRLEGYDVVFSIIGNTPLPDSDLVAKKIAEPKTVLVCASNYCCNVQQPEDLAQVECVATLAQDRSPVCWQLSKQEQSHSIYPQPAVLVNNIDAVKQAVLNGLGVGHLVKAFCQQEIESGELVCLLDDWQLQSWQVFAIYPSRKYLPVKTRRFIELVSAWAANK